MMLTTSEHQSYILKPPLSMTAHACKFYLHMQEGCWWILQLHQHSGQDNITISTASLQSPCHSSPNVKDLHIDATSLFHHFRLESSKAVWQLSGTRYYYCI